MDGNSAGQNQGYSEYSSFALTFDHTNQFLL